MDGFTISLRSIAKHERDHKGEAELAAIIESAADEIVALRNALIRHGRRTWPV